MARLGELEAAVMNVLWDAPGPLAVRDVLQALPAERPLAYTTVLTVMTRLHEKGRLARESVGSGHRYRPTATRAQVAAAVMAAALADSVDRAEALLHFATQIGPADAAELRRALGMSD